MVMVTDTCVAVVAVIITAGVEAAGITMDGGVAVIADGVECKQ
jgi:hypothetical protein